MKENVIVIGAGIGGLSCAALLAHGGHKAAACLSELLRLLQGFRLGLGGLLAFKAQLHRLDETAVEAAHLDQ